LTFKGPFSFSFGLLPLPPCHSARKKPLQKPNRRSALDTQHVNTPPPSPRPPPAAPCLGQGAPKKKKESDVPTYLPFLRFFAIFRSDFRKYFYGVFGLLMLRNGQKSDKTNRWKKKKKISTFPAKSF
jgi:hypothetical protein